MMRIFDPFNKRKLMISCIALGLLLATSPMWTWYLKPSRALQVLIVDKTVPDRSYRNHAGVTWLLNNDKIVQASGKPYNPATDYIGFKPGQGGKSYATTAMPADLSGYDLIYLADLYGVDKESFLHQQPGAGESKSLYGGLQREEFEAIRAKLLTGGGTLVAEYNLFGKPTSVELRTDMYSLLHIGWKGWVGRYVADLAGIEVPEKTRLSYEAQHGGKWPYKDSGYLFMNEFTEEVLVLTKEDLSDEVGGGDGAPRFAFTEQGMAELGVGGQQAYAGWFDVIEAVDEREVLAEFRLPLSSTGTAKLSRRHIPLTLPAVVHHQNRRYGSYYLCGQFSANPELPDIYQSTLQTAIRKLPTWHGAEDAFYWRIYAPLMKAIIARGMSHSEKPVSVQHAIEGGVAYNVRIVGDHFQTLKQGKWTDFIVKGVNIGMGKPGAFPGNAAIRRDEYFRWFQQIAAMNANSVRVYTLQPPAFYEALYEFNRTTDKPLYLFHGAWVSEDALVGTNNAFSDEVTVPFHEEVVHVVDAVHGHAELPKRAGHAYGSYTYDVSRYLLGWILGIEWDPHAVAGTNANAVNKRKPQFMGKHIYTKGASPFEMWLAQGMDYIAEYERKKYREAHALSFTNWPTTDLLKHPLETFGDEDMVTVNPNHIYTRSSYLPGSFASYHIYPYYPDFINNEYKTYVNHAGVKDNYAGYLHALKAAHRLPIMVAEFGIPGSRGMTHRNVYGKDQGHHSEQEQGRFIAELYEDMLAEHYAGGMIFSWQDEWFKRTWNTMEYDNPHRRPFWSNIQTNEQYFGMLSFDPGENRIAIDVDGDTLDWDTLGIAPLYDASADSSQNLKALYMTNDIKYLYLRLDYRRLDKDAIQTTVLLDTVDKQGNTKLPKGLPFANEVGFDFYLDIASSAYAEAFIDSYYDTFYYHYAYLKKLIPSVSGVNKRNNGMYHPIRLVLNKGSKMMLPTGKLLVYPFESYHTGLLQHGNSNTQSPEYDSLADYHVNEANGVIELRIPWLMLNMKDPSLHEAMGDLWTSGKGYGSSTVTAGYRMLVIGRDGNAYETLPAGLDASGRKPIREPMLRLFKWGEWNQPYYHERLKRSYYVMQQAYAKH
ncbi:hypothetical protein [Paenibacillus silvisoli]|uniref:hypothetical protein n=1 Tax=Paenibacillus silvisoli TaxID=3110539 RepID=UPI002804D871|nr:hypothetical protein [Paenibacillus silvisoli]